MKSSHHLSSGPAALLPAHKAWASNRLQSFTSPHFVQHAMLEGQCGGAAPPPCQVATNVALQADSSGCQQLGTCRAVGACRPGSGQQCTGLADAQVKGAHVRLLLSCPWLPAYFNAGQCHGLSCLARRCTGGLALT